MGSLDKKIETSLKNSFIYSSEYPREFWLRNQFLLFHMCHDMAPGKVQYNSQHLDNLVKLCMISTISPTLTSPHSMLEIGEFFLLQSASLDSLICNLKKTGLPECVRCICNLKKRFAVVDCLLHISFWSKKTGLTYLQSRSCRSSSAVQFLP